MNKGGLSMYTQKKRDFLVVGNINLDIIPSLPHYSTSQFSQQFFVPGSLVEVAAPTIATGGAAANTGIALSKLGFSADIVAKVANDLWGQQIINLLEAHTSTLSNHLIIEPNGNTSCTIVINNPDNDRMFLHYPGVNDNLGVADIADRLLLDSKIFHFGYPPLIKKMYENQGIELLSMFQKAKAMGAITSLDMAKPDPSSASGLVNWRSILERTLPYVDIFLPSFEELLYMLDYAKYIELELQYGRGNVSSAISLPLLQQLSTELMELGCTIVGIKLGDKGFYLRTHDQFSKFDELAAKLEFNISEWSNQELIFPCFQVASIGTTGAGDCTVAGFLAGLLMGQSPHDTVLSALAVGAHCVERADATSGIPTWQDVQNRINNHWSFAPLAPCLVNTQ